MERDSGVSKSFTAYDITNASSIQRLEWSKIGYLSLVLAIVLVLSKAFFNLYLHPIARYPGPRLCAISSIPVALAQLSGRCHRFTEEAHRKYGDVVRISPNELSFSSGAAWNDIYGRKGGKPPLPRDQQFFNDMLIDAHSLVLADDEKHARIRRAMTAGFSPKALAAQEPIIQHNIDLLQKQLSTLAKQGLSIDLRQWYNYVTFDLIGDLAFGESFNCLTNATYNEWVIFILDHFFAATLLHVVHRFRPLNHILAALIPTSLMEKKKHHENLAIAKIRRRILNGAVDRPDFIQPLLEAQRKGEMSMEEVEQQSSVFILAGSETTSVALTSATQLLLSTPRALKLLEDELRAQFQTESEINVLSINKLKYLQAVIQESLRLIPPISNGFGRQTTSATTINGHLVPANTVVNISHWAAYRSEDTFVRPTEFLPERWLDDPTFDGDRKETLQPFSVGPRSCIAKKFAYDNMKLILARILWRYKLDWEPSSREAYETEMVSYISPHQPPLLVKLVPRHEWRDDLEA